MDEAEQTRATKTRLTKIGRGGGEREAKQGGKMRETNTATSLWIRAEKREILRQTAT